MSPQHTQIPDVPNISTATGAEIPSLESLKMYHEDGKNYLVRAEQQYIQMNETSLRRHLRSLGFPNHTRGSELSEVEKTLHFIQMCRHVTYSGPLAGKSEGLHTINGMKVLVTRGLELIEPGPAPRWDFIHEIVSSMLGHDQMPFFYGWLKVAYEALRARRAQPGQALAIAGPKNAGKSLLQAIIVEVLGGRSANPYAFMTGRTPFNRELFGCENLVFGDEISSTDGRARRDFGSRLKQLTVNKDQCCHGKGREAVTLSPFWRVTISLNDETENVCVLPPLDDSIADKLIIFRAKRPVIMDTPEWGHDRQKNWTKIVGELPAFISFLTDFSIPEQLRCDRFGVKHYHDPEILGMLSELSHERGLAELIDSTLFSAFDQLFWEGTGAELERILTARDGFGYDQAKRLLHWQNSAATYLTRLCKLNPSRYSKRIVNGKKIYTIKRQARETGGEGSNRTPVISRVEGGPDSLFSNKKVKVRVAVSPQAGGIGQSGPPSTKLGQPAALQSPSATAPAGQKTPKKRTPSRTSRKRKPRE
jgi:hypothetical protein